MLSIFTIIIVLFTSLSAVCGTITGKVIDSITRDPIAGASVFLTEPICSTLSKSDGRFTLELPETRVVIPVKPREISAIPAATRKIFFNLSGRKLPERKVFPAGIILQRGRKLLFLPGTSTPSLSGVAATSMSAAQKTASAEFNLSVSASGYQPASRDVEHGDVGEILLAPEAVDSLCVVNFGIGLDSIGTMNIRTEIIPLDSVVIIEQ